MNALFKSFVPTFHKALKSLKHPADITGVDNLFAASELVKPGNSITLVFYANAQPHVLLATITESYPFHLVTNDPNAAFLKNIQKAMLVAQDGKKLIRAEANIEGCIEHNNGYRIEIGYVRWEEVDRRRHPRYVMNLSAKVRAIQETEGEVVMKEITAKTEDVGLGGAWISLDEKLTKGSLVEFYADLSKTESIRTLAIVVNVSDERGGVGLEFLDFIGGSRYNLHSFLSKAS